MRFLQQDDDLLQRATKKGKEGLKRFEAKHNRRSIDNFPTPDYITR